MVSVGCCVRSLHCLLLALSCSCGWQVYQEESPIAAAVLLVTSFSGIPFHTSCGSGCVVKDACVGVSTPSVWEGLPVVAVCVCAAVQKRHSCGVPDESVAGFCYLFRFQQHLR